MASLLCVIRIWKSGRESPRTGHGTIIQGENKALIPGCKRRLNKLLNCTINLRVPVRMQIVDIAGEFDTAIILESNVRREPLVCIGPILRGHQDHPDTV